MPVSLLNPDTFRDCSELCGGCLSMVVEGPREPVYSSPWRRHCKPWEQTPPDNPRPLFKTPEANPSPPAYLIHSEWDTPGLAQQGFGKVLVNRKIREIHDQGVMAHLIRGPYIMFFQPTMEEPGCNGIPDGNVYTISEVTQCCSVTVQFFSDHEVLPGNVNGDGRIGLREAVFVLQAVSQMRYW